jgi:transcriptional regulator with XRE-family HTH domain
MAYAREFEAAVQRALAGRSLSQVARATGISKSHIGNASQGVIPSREKVLRLAEALEVDATPLLLAAGYAPIGMDPERPDLGVFTSWLVDRARAGLQDALEAVRTVAQEAPKTGAQVLTEGLIAIAQEYGPQTVHFEAGMAELTVEEAEALVAHQRLLAQRMAAREASGK